MPPFSLPESVLLLARALDHTLLRPDASQEDIEALCKEALQYPFASICVQPYWVPFVVPRMYESGVAVSTVVGFPLGANTTTMKVAETQEAVAAGATEIDMVLNIGELCGGNIDAVFRDMEAVISAAREEGAITKVILETAYLSDSRKHAACEMARDARAAFVKTSTGFASSGATVADVALLRSSVPATMGVKASGGIRTLDDARAMLSAGANRIGTSAGVKIIQSALSEVASESNTERAARL
ncbi:MAG: deoxyribose-phosphate aldolase [Acidobacteriota bacterium]